jgi:proteasome activator subunit 4
VPDDEELDFALEIFKEIVEPTLGRLENLLEPGMCHGPTYGSDSD